MMRMLLQDALAVDPVLKAERLPKFHAELVAALADLQRDDRARLRSRGGGWSRVSFDSVCGRSVGVGWLVLIGGGGERRRVGRVCVCVCVCVL